MQLKPLKGLVVLDLSRVLAGPYCTMILQDLGAEIIKVERPEIGDDARGFGPFIGGKSIYFISLNRGKKSITLDLKTTEDRQKFLQLVKKSDILVENFKGGTMKKLGLDYLSLQQINPQLIYTAISGYGQTGPEAEKAAYDMIVQGRGGIMSITGAEGGPPVRVGMSIGDINAALFAVIGIGMALFQREKTNKGQLIDISMLDSQVAILENAIARVQTEKTPPQPLGTRHPSITPFAAFSCQDDYLIIACGNNKLWKSLCQAINREDLIYDQRFATNEQRTNNYRELHQILEQQLSTYQVSELTEILNQHGVPNGPINTIDKLFSDQQVLARKMLIDVLDPDLGTIKAAGNPIKMSSFVSDIKKEAAPDLGQHNAEVFQKYLDQ